MEKIRGKVIILGDDVDTDQILPGYAMSEPYEEIGKYAMAGLPTEDFKLNREPGCILVAGRNFGCGSSREHAPLSLREAGFSCIIAESFARIFYRNSMDTGLLLVECKVDAEEGGTAAVDVDKGTVEVDGRTYTFPEYPPFITELIRSGGLMNLIREGKFR